MIQKMPITLRRAGVATLVCGLALTASACGKDEKTTATASSTSTTTSTPSVSSTPSASATPTVKPTLVTNLDGVKVSPTTVGKTPTVTAKWPLAIKSTQVKTLTTGNGPVVGANDFVNVNYHGVDASTGKVFDSSFTRGTPVTFSLNGVVAGFKKAIAGQKVGSRVEVMMTAADGYPEGEPNAGINKGDNLVFVIDILGKSQPVAPKAGLPTVANDAKGIPTATIPKTAAPTKLVVQPLVTGPGAAVKISDNVAVSYRIWDWASGKLIEDAYTQQVSPVKAASLVPAMKTALVGQKVGSRMLVVMPPSAQVNNPSSASPSATATPSNRTLVYVIDIQGAQAAS